MKAEQNALLTRTGPGTPMGELFRRYWLPALLASELPEADGAPVRVQLLSERMIAFRDSEGKLGLMDEFCAHRGVSLWFGRNEDNGLRCPYHGWKYDTSGQCVDVPSEPVESGYCKKIKLKSYPLVERGGILWTYMGPPELQPELPMYEWATVPAGQRHISKRLQDCNYLQAMEGGLDSFHSTFLHRMSVGDDPLLKRDPASAALLAADRHPVFVPLESPGGLYIATRRNVDDERYYWRVTQWLMPCFNLFPPYDGNPFGGHAWVPVDDEHAWTFSIDYHPERDLTLLEVAAMEAGKGIHGKTIPGSFRPAANKDNDYLIDRVAQKERRTFCGVLGVAEQDAAVQESMGPIEDRTRENLVATDNGIIMTRQRLLKAARSVQEGGVPPGLDGATQRVRAFAAVLPHAAPLESAPEMQVVRRQPEQLLQEDAMQTIGLIGAGRMGLPIVGHLSRAGFRIVVSERNPERGPDIAARGGEVVEARVLAAEAEAILICVGYDKEVRELIQAPGGLLESARAGTIIAVLSTIHPKTMQELAQQAAAYGMHVVDSTVCRGGRAADEGTLLSFVGGAADVVERLTPVLRAYSSDVVHSGGVGTAQVSKAANNLILWACLVASHEGLALAQRYQVDVDALREALMTSSATNGALGNWGGQSMAWAQDDMAIVAEMAEDCGLSLPQSGLVRELCRTLKPRRYQLDKYGA